MQRLHRLQVLLQLLLGHYSHALSANFGEDIMNEQQQQKPNDQCLDMGYLVGLRDDEVTDDERAKARAHLTTCPDCAADERSVAISSREVYDLLAALDPLTD